MAGQEETLPVSPTAEATSYPEAIATLGEDQDSEEELEAGDGTLGEEINPEEENAEVTVETGAEEEVIPVVEDGLGHENGSEGIAPIPEPAIPAERGPKTLKAPKGPTKLEREQHDAIHCSYKP